MENTQKNIKTTIPVHNNQDVSPKLLLKILKDVGLSKEELQKLRKK